MQIHNTSLPLDPWVASSLLQKAIRRGESEYALWAGSTLHRQRGNAIWRRLTLIAFEDIGIGDLDLVVEVTRTANDRDFMASLGVDTEIIADLIGKLVAATKDRSTDYLICAATEHPHHEHECEDIACLPIPDRLSVAVDPAQPLIRRAVAACYAAGINGGGRQFLVGSELSRFLDAFEAIGFPSSLASAVDIAARKTREPIVVMLPILWAALHQNGETSTIIDVPIPHGGFSHGIRSLASISIPASGSRRSPSSLARMIPYKRLCRNLWLIIGHGTSPPWQHSMRMPSPSPADGIGAAHALEAVGLEADMMKIGCPQAGVLPNAEAVRTNLDHLNAIRRRLLDRSQRTRHARSMLSRDA